MIQSMENELKPNPLLQANIFSTISYWWLNDLFKRGNERRLNENDMFELCPGDKSAEVCNQLEQNWKNEIQNENAAKQPRLLTAIIKTYRKRMLIMGIFLAIVDSLRTGLPLLIAGLVRYFENRENFEIGQVYAYALAISFVSILLAYMHHTVFYRFQQVGWHMRTALCSVMYKKTLKLSHQSLSTTTVGQIINLFSNDVRGFHSIPQFLHYIWIAPVQCIVIGIIIWQEVGAAILTGLAILIMFGCIQALNGRTHGKLRTEIAHLTDERIRQVDEIITSIRAIKIHAWEQTFGKLVSIARREEVKKILTSSGLQAFNTCISLSQDKILVWGIILTYIGMGGVITASKIFGMIGLLRFQGHVAYKFGTGIQLLFEGKASIKRIQTYLSMDEVHTAPSKVEMPGKSVSSAIDFQNFSASWDVVNGNKSCHVNARLFKATLSQIDVRIGAGKLLAVVGRVGAGKSSFLSAIAGELPGIKGRMMIRGKSVHVTQIPWIFFGTIRENILFGESFDQDWYNTVIRACCLNKDLSLLSDGDLTLVGERGVMLSRGQKSRVNLARAAYRKDVDIFLLDDPLSAVDPAVAKHIFDNCIMGIMNKKIRILVTHQLQFLKNMHEIVILTEGKILERGTYDDFRLKGIDFATLWEIKDNPEENPLTKDSNMKTPLTRNHRGNIGRRQTLGPSTLQNKNLLGGFPARHRRTSLTYSFKPGHGGENAEEYLQRNSLTTNANILEEQDVKFRAMESEEKREQGSVGAKVYLEYLRSGGNAFLLLIFITVIIVGHAVFIMTDWWLSYWITEYNVYTTQRTSINATTLFTNSSPMLTTISATSNMTIDNSELNNFDTDFYRNIYTGFVVGMFLILLLQINMHFYICLKSGFNMHNKMLQSVLKAPVRFFDVNPAGRILNRFSKDIGLIDERLPLVLHDFLFMFFLLLSVVIMTTIFNHFVIIIVIPLVAYFVWLRRYYLRTSRDIKRMEGSCRSPVFSLITSTIQGLTTIRSFNVQDQFVKRFHEYQDLHSSSWFLFLVGSRWFGLRLDLITAIFVSAVAFLCVFASSILGIKAEQVGLILTYSFSMTHMFQFGVRQSAEVENLMTSVERVQQYCNIKPELDISTGESQDNWLTKGAIRLENLCFRYYESGPIVLHNITLNIHEKEKIGVVGRTGAGKSSLISAILRLSEITSGKIYIDETDVNSLKLSVLRSAISIIPQDPMLFARTLRKNIDPFDQYTDEDIWNSIEQVHLQDVVEKLPNVLDSELAESGSNFSVGQRQLVCLARAVLKRSKILIIDEATANVDVKTDHLIHETIRQRFQQCTVITIAHRINTVVDSDKILVLDEGRVKEFGEPHLLLQNTDGYLSKILNSCGVAQSSAMRKAAKETYEKKRQSFNEVISNTKSDLRHCELIYQ